MKKFSGTVLQDKMPPEGPELEAFRESRKAFDGEWPNCAGVLTGSTPIEPITLDVTIKNDDGIVAAIPEPDLVKDASQQLESKSLQ